MGVVSPIFPVILYLRISGALRQLWLDLVVFDIRFVPERRHLPLPGIVPVPTPHALFGWLTFMEVCLFSVCP
jgi:hypothetical protein